jgi:hypothetical protein
MTVRNGAIHFARRRLGGLDVLGCFDQRDGDLDVLGRPDLDSWLPLCPYRLHRKPVRQHRVMSNLMELGNRQAKAWREKDGSRSARSGDFEPVIARLGERAKLVDREEVVDPIAELLDHVSHVIRERPRNVA